MSGGIPIEGGGMSEQDVRIQGKVLAAMVNKGVSEKLGLLYREVGEITSDMPLDDARAAKLMILNMIISAAEDFRQKMASRIRDNKNGRG